MEFCILGPLEVSHDGEPVPVTGRHRPRLLARLLLDAGNTVTLTRLVECLWGAAPPRTARRQVQNAMASLRRELADSGADPIEATPGGYRIVVAPDAVDLERFDALVRQSHDTDNVERAASLLRQGLRLWRGEPLAGLTKPGLTAAAARLSESHLTAVQDRIDADIRLGHGAEVVAELRELVERHPLRQRLTAQLMTALHQCDRTAEAERAFEDLRRRLAEETGLDPNRQVTEVHEGLSRNSVPQRAASAAIPVPAQLPAAPGSFTGREEQLRVLDRLLNDGGESAVISAIAGMGGVGKTALALKWAHRVRDRFPDGQLYINLRGFDVREPVAPLEALARFLVALGQPAGSIPDEVTAAAELFRSLLAEQRMLVVLDNCRDAAQVRPLLPGAGGNFVLITSRNRLAPLTAVEHSNPISLDTLEPRESALLLSALIGDDRLRREPRAGRQIAELCGQLPLALRILAANLAAQPRRRLADVVDDLGGPRRLELLAVEQDPFAAVTHTLDLSVDALEPPARRLLFTLGLIPGEDFGRDLLDAIASSPPATAPLAQIESANLVERHEFGRFRFHDLVREYLRHRAVEELGEPEIAEFRSRFVDWHYDRHRSLPPAECDNVIAALTAWRDDEQSWKLAVSLQSFASTRSGTTVDTLLRLAERGRRQAEATGNIYGRCLMLNTLATLARESGDRNRAIDYGTDAATLAETLPDGHDGRFHGNLGNYLGEVGRYGDAARLHRLALRAATAKNNRRNMMVCSGNLGNALRFLGRFDEAEEQFVRVLDFATAADDGIKVQQALHHLASLHRDRGDLGRAKQVQARMRALIDPSVHVRLYIFWHLVQADICLAEGEVQAGRGLLATAAQFVRDTGRRGLNANVDLIRARYLNAEGDFPAALRVLDDVAAEHSLDVDEYLHAEVDLIRCASYAGLSDLPRAIVHGEAARDRFARLPVPLKLAESLRTLAEAQEAAGEAAADRSRRQAANICESLGIPAKAS